MNTDIDQRSKASLEQAIAGCIVGTAVGDAIGLPCEGMSRRRQRKLFSDISGYRFLLGRGMVSDDTEHTCLVAQALIVSGGEPDAFARSLARGMRLWLLGIPAGVGLATLRACLRLCVGFDSRRSGVFSAGNGPAMRSALIGVCFGDDLPRLRQLVRISTRITHTDPKAEYGALAVALAAHVTRCQPASGTAAYSGFLEQALDGEGADFLNLVRLAVASAAAGDTTEEFADSMGQAWGVSGYIYNTVPVVLHAWCRNPTDFRAAITEVVRCGGDTDTTGAILGAIMGAGLGIEGLPSAWLTGLREWPRSVDWMMLLGRSLAETVAERRSGAAPSSPFLLSVPRNLLFLIVVLAHGFRRLLPPY